MTLYVREIKRKTFQIMGQYILIYLYKCEINIFF